MNNDNKHTPAPSLPREARLPINRCNLPAEILGGLTYQQHPVALYLDGVHTLHRQLFEQLDGLDSAAERAERFMDYMVVQFRLHRLEEAGLVGSEARGKADYIRLLRGWLFDADGREAAVLKAWVESRFGLLPRHHHGALADQEGAAYRRYICERAEGLYGTNALEAQLDLLYSYCQYELDRCYEEDQRLTLFRGINRLQEFEILHQFNRHESIVLLNNINSFTSKRERADEFGDIILEVKVPWQKCLYASGLLPLKLVGEDEYIVIGGVYRVTSAFW